jgi:predicted neutral ceramidase superfamily lipid hydrolase
MNGPNSKLAEDLLVGAAAIAREFNGDSASGAWNVNRVYRLASMGILPIHHIPGLGICARRSSLLNFFSTLDERLKVQHAATTAK